MAMKNLVIRSAHFCANTSLEFDKCESFAKRTARTPHVDVSAVPVWVNCVEKERKEGTVIILQEVGQRRTRVPTNRKLDWNCVLLSLRSSKIPFSLQHSGTSCIKFFHFTSAMFWS